MNPRHTDQRGRQLDRLTGADHDVLIVGGGINGAVSALALAAHGLRTALVEQGDFASGVSQESSNLVWGGFKYLQNYEIGLVAGLCRSRNRLARAYPSQLRETRFLAALGETSPYGPAFATLGAHAYWMLGRCATRRPRMVTTGALQTYEPVVDPRGVRGAIEYSDYLLVDNDARFVMRLLLDAIDAGAVAVSRVRLDEAERAAGMWKASVTDVVSGVSHEVSARLLVNAAGPSAESVAKLLRTRLASRLCLSKGAHLVVPRIGEPDRILAFFDDESRLFYVMPMGDRSVIGTTDTRVERSDVSVTEEDRNFLLDQANSRLRLAEPLQAGDIISYRCGVRPLVVGADDDPNSSWTDLSRRHEVQTDEASKVISILGGKLSDCLNIGEEVVREARRCGLESDTTRHRGAGARATTRHDGRGVRATTCRWFGEPGATTRHDGQYPRAMTRRWFGEPSASERADFLAGAARLGAEAPAAARLWRRHGPRSGEVLELIRESPELAAPLSDRVDYCAAEIMVMARHEQILTLDDFLRRRSMLSMLETPETLAADAGIAAAARLLFDTSPASSPLSDATLRLEADPATTSMHSSAISNP